MSDESTKSIESLEETDIQRYFFRFLKKYGIDITISCNEEFNHEILF